MPETVIRLRRASAFWGEVSPESVKRYLDELVALGKQLTDFIFLYENTLFGGRLRQALCNEIDDEIKHCLFYEEFNERQKEPNFDKWVFRTKEEVNANQESWRQVSGDQWTKTNGRLKAIIQFDKSGLMVKITLGYENDSKNLNFYKFYKKPYNYKEASFHLKSEASIEARLQELKNEADAFLNKQLYPYTDYEAELLNKLLHITDG